MSYLATLSLIILSTTLITTRAATFNVRNNCPYVVWAAASSPGGGRQLNTNEEWSFDVAPGTQYARIWGRTNCNSDATFCQTGDCGKLDCTGYGKTPNTVAEFALNQFNNHDYYDISVVDGFNIPMEFGPATDSAAGECKLSSCTADIMAQCPGPLKIPGGCNSPCTVYKTNEYCCSQANEPCSPTDYSRFFKDRCPTSLSYKADQTGNRSCPGGTNYKVVFCP